MYGLNLNNEEVADFYEQIKQKYDRIENSEQAVISKVGNDLYEKFLKTILINNGIYGLTN